MRWTFDAHIIIQISKKVPQLWNRWDRKKKDGYHVDEIFNTHSTRLIFELSQCKVVKLMLVWGTGIQTKKGVASMVLESLIHWRQNSIYLFYCKTVPSLYIFSIYKDQYQKYALFEFTYKIPVKKDLLRHWICYPKTETLLRILL